MASDPTEIVVESLTSALLRKKRHIGIVIFLICSAVSARLALFEPEPHMPSAAEDRWGTHRGEKADTLTFLHGLRFYIYGVGLIGLAIVAEDYLNERWMRKKLNTEARRVAELRETKISTSFR